jgi:hypothetical protein
MGSTASVGGTVAGSSEVAQQNGSQGGAGTGFVNIDKYLNANRGAGGAVKARADQALAKDAGAFGTKLGDATTAMNAAPSVSDPTKLVSDVLGTTTPGSDFGNSSADKGTTVARGTPSADLQADAIAAAKAALGATYTAPLEVGHDVGNTADAKRAAALADSKTAGKQIATDNGTLASYGTGLQAIDRAIYGSAGEAPTLGQAATALDAQTADQGAKSTAFATASKGKSDALTKNKEEIRGAFMSEADKIKAKAQADADAALAEQSRAKTDIIPTAADRATWDPGSGDPTAANFLDAGGLNAIGSVLGDDALINTKAGPAYVPGKNVYAPVGGGERGDTIDEGPAPDPIGQIPGSSVVAKPTYTTQQVANATRDLTPAQLATYKAIRQNDPNISPAEAAEKARGTTDTQGNVGGADVRINPEPDLLNPGVNDQTPSPESAAAAGAQLTPAQQQRFNEIRKNYPDMSPQEAAEYARTGRNPPGSIPMLDPRNSPGGNEAISQIDAAIKMMLGLGGG